MKIKKEEINDEGIKLDPVEIKKENIKKEEDVASSCRASLSRFANPSSPPSARTRPKRPSSDSNPDPSSSVSLTVTVAVGRPTPVTVRQHESNNEESVDPSPAVQARRRSSRKRKTRPSLDAGDGGESDIIRPLKKMKKRRQGNPRVPEEDLSHLGALPEYLAEDLDGTFLQL